MLCCSLAQGLLDAGASPVQLQLAFVSAVVLALAASLQSRSPPQGLCSRVQQYAGSHPLLSPAPGGSSPCLLLSSCLNSLPWLQQCLVPGRAWRRFSPAACMPTGHRPLLAFTTAPGGSLPYWPGTCCSKLCLTELFSVATQYTEPGISHRMTCMQGALFCWSPAKQLVGADSAGPAPFMTSHACLHTHMLTLHPQKYIKPNRTRPI